MTNKEFFDINNIELFMPDGVEFIYTILQNIGFTDFSTNEAREKGLETIKKLLELNLIDVFHWGEHHSSLKDENISNDELICHLENIWFNGADFEHFSNMIMFKFKDWYLSALKNAGLTNTTNWKTFIKENIGDLEKWIEENKPKEE